MASKNSKAFDVGRVQRDAGMLMIPSLWLAGVSRGPLAIIRDAHALGATEIALSALSETQQALTALAQVPIPAAVTITRTKGGIR
jgi:hypothetical protein